MKKILVATLATMLLVLSSACIDEERSMTSEKLEQFRTSLNQEMTGKFKVSFERNLELASYRGLVSYNLIIYADPYDGLEKDLRETVRKLFVSTAGVSQNIRYIEVRIISTSSVQPVLRIVKLEELRKDPAAWESLLEEPVIFYLVPRNPISFGSNPKRSM